MGTSKIDAKWWTKDQYEGPWERAKEALRRDFEQTKVDLGVASGPNIDQDVSDTIKQAAGADVIPPEGVPNEPGGTPRFGSAVRNPRAWNEVETPVQYGFAARQKYAPRYAAWNAELEAELRKDWDAFKDQTKEAWDDVKSFVRQGFESKHSHH